MDWSKAHTTPAPRPAPVGPRRLCTLFRVQGASGRPLRCAVYEAVMGRELRVEYEDREDDVLRTQLFKVVDEEAIPELAAQWRGALDERGFTELPLLQAVPSR